MTTPVACRTDCLPTLEPDEVLPPLQDCGFEHVEVVLKTEPSKLRDSLTAWISALQSRQMQCVNLNLGKSLARGIETSLAATLFQTAAAAGISLVTLDAGNAEDDSERASVVSGLRKLGDLAQTHSITLALDTQPGLCQESRTMGRFLNEVDHPSVLLCFDTGGYINQNPVANGEVALQRLLGWMAALRLSDADEGRPAGSAPYFPPLGYGGVDFARTHDFLKGCSFREPCIVEFSPWKLRMNGKPQAVDLTTTVGWLRDSRRHLKLCGWPIEA